MDGRTACAGQGCSRGGGRGALKGGGGQGVWRGPPPPPRVPLWSPPEGGPKFLKRKSSWPRRRRSKILAVSLKHRKGRRGGLAPPPPPPLLLLRCTAVLIHRWRWGCVSAEERSGAPLPSFPNAPLPLPGRSPAPPRRVAGERAAVGGCPAPVRGYRWQPPEARAAPPTQAAGVRPRPFFVRMSPLSISRSYRV